MHAAHQRPEAGPTVRAVAAGAPGCRPLVALRHAATCSGHGNRGLPAMPAAPTARGPCALGVHELKHRSQPGVPVVAAVAGLQGALEHECRHLHAARTAAGVAVVLPGNVALGAHRHHELVLLVGQRVV